MAIRALSSDDVEVYRTIRLRALAADPAMFSSTFEREAAYDDATWRSRMEGFEGRPGQIFVDDVLADDASVTVGPVSLGPRLGGATGVVGVGASVRPRDAVLWGMWVAPEARGRGVGRRLADVAVDWAREAGLSTVTLWVMRSNESARRLYARCGFDELTDAGRDAPDGCADEIRMCHTIAAGAEHAV